MSNTSTSEGGQFVRQKDGSWVNRKDLPVEPIMGRSLKEVPFCPYCGDELDSVDMLNCFSECSCGRWSEHWNLPYTNRKEPPIEYFYKPKPAPKDIK